ncbi:MAG: methionine biosynthesis protein MetW [Betaproteobacteria bacterium]|nr:methionine biosynthesis protein MetW [Betaproteobacteria bacterium]
MTDADRALLASRPDLATIAQWVAPNARVLDLGCGDGMLLRYLWKERGSHGYGVEIDDAKVGASVRNDVNVLQMDLESGLSAFGDGSFDYVILSQTLQAMRHTEDIMREMVRVGREAIVSFPNFGHWASRLQVVKGRMPVSESLPHAWYNTPNLHLCTIADFEDLARKIGLNIEERVVLHEGRPVTLLPNLFGSLAVYRCAAG